MQLMSFFNVHKDAVKLLLGKCDAVFVLRHQHPVPAHNSQSYGPVEHSCNDVIKFDRDTVTYVYVKAVGIFLMRYY
jgi:KaiC/GvpD/RAD55 family RecA-like ATPase